MRKNVVILFSFILVSHFCFAGTGDSLKLPKKSSLTFFNSTQFEYSDSLNYLQNSLNGFQNQFSKYIIGNVGLAYNSLDYAGLRKGVGFNYSRNNFIDYFFTKNNLLFFDTHTPYTDLLYLIGSKKEQDFKMTFSYNLKKNWNLTANFFRIRSEGFYLRQNTNDNFISISSNYKSATNRYHLLVGLMYNSIQNSENGGISNDSLFENGENLDKRLFDVNLISAKRSNLNRSFFINQYLNFGKKKADSSSTNTIVPSSRICIATSFEDNLIKYEDGDPLSGFYSNIYVDSSSTYDSTYNLNFENELSWKRLCSGSHTGFAEKFGIGLSIKDQFVMVKQGQVDSVFQNIIAGGEVYNMYSDHKFFYLFSGNYCLSGGNKNDYSINGSMKKYFGDSLFYINVHANKQVQSPDFIFNRYYSNHFEWNNVFEKISENSVSLDFVSKKHRLEVGIKFKQITNPTYFDNYAIARQYKGSIPVVSSFIRKNFTFLNWHLDNTIKYQYVPDSTIIRLPQFVLEHSLYYETALFKEATVIQIGASVFFVSEYYANSYMPATGQFYIQDDKKYGNYPFIDFFINARIKSVRVFFKIDHLNYGWMGNKYQLTPHYPMNDRAFKLGISWRFYD